MGSFFKTIIILACILVIIVSAGLFVYKTEKRKSSDFATDAANDISVSWQVDELKKRAHPTMIENINKSGHKIEDYFAVLSKLGVLKTIMECTLSHSGVTDFPQFYLSADYVCHGDYEKGPATMVLGLRKDDIKGPWQIVDFHIDSPVFGAPAAQQKQ